MGEAEMTMRRRMHVERAWCFVVEWASEVGQMDVVVRVESAGVLQEECGGVDVLGLECKRKVVAEQVVAKRKHETVGQELLVLWVCHRSSIQFHERG